MTDALPLGVRRSPLDGTPLTVLNAGAVGDALWAEFDPFDWLAQGSRSGPGDTILHNVGLPTPNLRQPKST